MERLNAYPAHGNHARACMPIALPLFYQPSDRPAAALAARAEGNRHL
ncbi:hypothetical protein [Candidatus Nitrotoga arctica]|nr:hypothetical protein [Candidatus Nitrotoga arctica]